MLFWLGLVAGAIIGWVVEWVIDWRYWRSDLSVTTDEERQLRKELDIARLEIGKLQNQVQQQSLGTMSDDSAKDSSVKDLPTKALSTNPKSTSDRLQDVTGVGQVYAKKLNDADIYTFAQLSETSVERLTDIINPQEWQSVDFDAWIRQARAFVQHADRGK